MNLKDYQDWTETVAVYPKGEEETYLALGIGNEVGEFQGVIKKRLRGDFINVDNKIFTDKALAELGDILWYLVRLCDYFGITLSELADINYKKLEDRKARDKLKGDGDTR